MEKLAVNVANFFNRTFFKISEEGDKMMNSNLEKYRQVNFNITMSLIDSILKGIEFFEKICLSQDKWKIYLFFKYIIIQINLNFKSVIIDLNLY